VGPRQSCALFNLANEPLKGLVCNIGRVTTPMPRLIPTELSKRQSFPADIQAMIGEPFAPDLLRAAAFAHRMDQLDAVGVDDAEHRRAAKKARVQS